MSSVYHNFFGIDIGKEEFFVNLYGCNKVNSFTNNNAGFVNFMEHYKQEIKDSFCVLENTGGYENELTKFLYNKGLAVHKADTRKSHYFIKSLGKKAKTDALDAKGLSAYAFERHRVLGLFSVDSEEVETLKLLNARRAELVDIRASEKNRKSSPNYKKMADSCDKIINCLSEEIKDLDNKINDLIQDNPELKEKSEVLQEIPGIGSVNSAKLIAILPELGKLDRKQIASLTGLAPMAKDSGKSIGYRMTRHGRKGIKALLCLAVMSAIRGTNNISEFYQKLINAGKKPMVAIIACARKMITVANAKIRDLIQKRGEIDNKLSIMN